MLDRLLREIPKLTDAVIEAEVDDQSTYSSLLPAPLTPLGRLADRSGTVRAARATR